MATSATRGLITASALVTSIFAGLNFNRSLIEMPAWRQTGVEAWAAFSRHADLGRGEFWYPLLGFAGTVLCIAAAVAISRDHAVSRNSVVATYSATVLQVAGLLVTLKAAPYMTSTPHLLHNPAALQRAFGGFEFWGSIRSAFQIAGFVAIVWALAALTNGRSAKQPS